MQAAIFSNEPPTAGRIVSVTLSLLVKYPVAFLVLALFWAMPMTAMAAGGVLSESDPQLATMLYLAGLVSIFTVMPAGYGAVMVAVFQAARDGNIDLGACVGTGFSRLGRTIATFVLTALVVIGGTLLLVIPGVIAAYAFAISVPVVMLEAVGPIQAMRRSAALTKGYRLMIFGASFLLGLLSVPFNVLDAITRDPGAKLVWGLLGGATGLIQLVGSGVLYYALRAHRESLGIDEIAGAFD